MPDHGRDVLPYDGRAVLYESLIDTRPYDLLQRRLDWHEEAIRLFGKRYVVPRLIAYYGEHPYRYAGVDHPPRPLPEVLIPLHQKAEARSGFAFNSVLCNWYRHGQDGMGYHRDNEPEIDPRCIASLSFGATRRFKLRHRRSREVVSLDLSDGSMLLLLDCQAHWEHALVKTKKPVGGRINLTFRMMNRQSA